MPRKLSLATYPAPSQSLPNTAPPLTWSHPKTTDVCTPPFYQGIGILIQKQTWQRSLGFLPIISDGPFLKFT